ncbi:Deoxyuridine 5'-triphosphate nucleotidohydrolase -like protein [Gossypium arboreum]|uniref:Deoxyuridine 5'-triphosphate nucleotidohydrolase n=1 Tax=Gossypium arboreum TaxID=29729 RepID=A0A0B0PFT1_GOSAR|nr:Deoxyuridine 5'-triphosphate nucleotidohydrolase -like protein [Gossypium arboreum]
MAGTLGAISSWVPIIPALFLYNNNRCASRSLVFKPVCWNRPSVFSTFPRSLLTMAQADQINNSPENKEPSPKVTKLCQNGVHEVTQGPASLLKVKKLSEKAVLPSRGSPLAAGYDLSSATDTKVPARGKALIPTDLSIAIPEGTYGRVAPRSGLAWKHSIDVGAGVIDADYRGPLGVILFNHSDVDFEVKVGDRIAQLIIEKIMTPDVLEVDDLDSTTRGAGGFGSTGV